MTQSETPPQVSSIQTPPEKPPARTHDSSNRPPSVITAGCCDAKWTGIGAAHCSRCHHTFTSAGAFDHHRRRGGQCVDPASIGMVPANRDWPGWSLPGTWSGPE